VVASIIDSGLSVKSWEGNGMTKEELIYQARERASLEVAFDGSFQIADLLVALADALEAATNPVMFGTEYGRKKRMTGEVYGPLKGDPLPSWWGESQEDYLHVQRTVGPWEVVE
jgi:hypothetical protein